MPAAYQRSLNWSVADLSMPVNLKENMERGSLAINKNNYTKQKVKSIFIFGEKLQNEKSLIEIVWMWEKETSISHLNMRLFWQIIRKSKSKSNKTMCSQEPKLNTYQKYIVCCELTR